MSFTIVAGDRLHVVGNSITFFGFASATGSLFDQINATWPNPAMSQNPGRSTGSSGVVVSGANGAVVATQPTRKQTTDTTSGVPGNKAADIAAAVASRIVAFNPSKLIIEVGINDQQASTNPAAFAASYDSIVTQTQSALPSCQIMCLSLLSFNEQWVAGPAWPADSVVTYNNAIQTVCTNRGCTYVDLRAPLLAYEVINNSPPPGAGSGIETSDGIHPIIPGGQVNMGTWVFANLTVTP